MSLAGLAWLVQLLGRLGAAVTPPAEPSAWACFRLLSQFELERLSQSHLVGVLLQHGKKGTGLVGADRQVRPVAIDCEPNPFGEAVISPETSRDVRGCVVSEVDPENEHCRSRSPFSIVANVLERLDTSAGGSVPLAHDFAVERVRDAFLPLWEADVPRTEREKRALVGHMRCDVQRADLVVVVRSLVAPFEDAGDAHLLRAFDGARDTHSSAGSTTSVQMKRGISLAESSFLMSQSTPLMVYVSPSTTRRPSILGSPSWPLKRYSDRSASPSAPRNVSRNSFTVVLLPPDPAQWLRYGTQREAELCVRERQAYPRLHSLNERSESRLRPRRLVRHLDQLERGEGRHRFPGDGAFHGELNAQTYAGRR